MLLLLPLVVVVVVLAVPRRVIFVGGVYFHRQISIVQNFVKYCVCILSHDRILNDFGGTPDFSRDNTS